MLNLTDNLYDVLMENTDFIDFNFLREFPATWYDNSNQTIYLAKKEGVELFKLKIERV